MGKSGQRIIIIVVFLIAIVIVLGRIVTMDINKPVRIGDYAPDFSIKDMSGDIYKLSQKRGKVIFINFWATWCKPCLDEMPSIEEMFRMFKNDNIEVIGISIDKHGKDVVKSFIERFDISFPILLDLTEEVGLEYGITGVPETFIVDEKGIIVEKVIGPRDWMNENSLKMVKYFLKK